MLRRALLLPLWCLTALVVPGHSQEPKSAVDGKWEMAGKGADGNPVRIVKEHRNGQTTRSVYNEKGEIVQQYTSQYEVRKTDNIQIFTFRNLEVVAGPNKGQKVPGPGEYIYRVEGDAFYEIQGALSGDKGAPRIVVWKRAQAKSPAPF